MKTGTVVLLGIGGLVLWEAYNLSVGTGTMQIVFKGVQINSLTNYTITLTAQNVSNVSISINSMTGNVLINGNQLASISDFTVRTIPANGQIDIPITVQPSLLSIPVDIQQLITNGGQTIDFTVTGNVNASGFVLPFSLDQTFNL